MKPAHELPPHPRGGFSANCHIFSKHLKCELCNIAFSEYNRDPRPCPEIQGQCHAQLKYIRAELERWFTEPGLVNELEKKANNLLKRLDDIEALQKECDELLSAPKK